MSRNYPYTVEKQEDGKFLVKFVDFPAGVTEADTEQEASVLAQEILEGLVEVYTEEGMSLPEPSPVGNMAFATA